MQLKLSLFFFLFFFFKQGLQFLSGVRFGVLTGFGQCSAPLQHSHGGLRSMAPHRQQPWVVSGHCQLGAASKSTAASGCKLLHEGLPSLHTPPKKQQPTE